MAKLFRTTVGTTDVFVEFVCRYRNVNTYGIRVRGESNRTELRINDDGTVYENDAGWIGPVCLEDAMMAIAAFNANETREFETWKSANPAMFA